MVIVMFSFYHTNYVKRFVLKRPFYKGKKDKGNEFKVRELGYHCFVDLCMHNSTDIIC